MSISWIDYVSCGMNYWCVLMADVLQIQKRLWVGRQNLWDSILRVVPEKLISIHLVKHFRSKEWTQQCRSANKCCVQLALFQRSKKTSRWKMRKNEVKVQSCLGLPRCQKLQKVQKAVKVEIVMTGWIDLQNTKLVIGHRCLDMLDLFRSVGVILVA